jgi:hypothetical protein
MKHLLRNRPFRPSLIARSHLGSLSPNSGGGGGGGSSSGLYGNSDAYNYVSQTFDSGSFNGVFNASASGNGHDMTIEQTFSAPVNGSVRSNCAFSSANLGTWTSSNPRILSLKLTLTNKTNLTQANGQNSLLLGLWIANKDFTSITASDDGLWTGMMISPVYGGTPFDGSGQARGLRDVQTGLPFLTSGASAPNIISQYLNVAITPTGRIAFGQAIATTNQSGVAFPDTWVRNYPYVTGRSAVTGTLYGGAWFGTEKGSAAGTNYSFSYTLESAITSA